MAIIQRINKTTAATNAKIPTVIIAQPVLIVLLIEPPPVYPEEALVVNPINRNQQIIATAKQVSQPIK